MSPSPIIVTSLPASLVYRLTAPGAELFGFFKNFTCQERPIGQRGPDFADLPPDLGYTKWGVTGHGAGFGGGETLGDSPGSVLTPFLAFGPP
ncbi:hypothetical protein SMACR_00636 [Sordaria macrospora]|uniref:WGS project CABT00000000 data, contig 2.2 n=2 Tax=Sordaria macrospora TaxID=5147 RepID=F7VMN2_SORMK|nr:uncharacterized protein SMAC_00636 [Sordaria macrospora k-hell]KAA8633462.1 hypothetical protein SMACR_00636 [Sordaria macrospora]WPJ66912.1 hypothetical protein SMAC4_00636 [Sordaria macrospora]CCC06611.1 unnamed protein product [Sordaria macrospora k-hell]